ncbi:hypothetical protein ACWGQ5_45840 [Streptomyces sp. NPDC055722]
MEIIPELGVDLVKIGDQRSQVEERIGPPFHGPGGLRAVYTTSPMLVITYAADETVELVEIRYSGDGSDTEVHYDEVQLTFLLSASPGVYARVSSSSARSRAAADHAPLLPHG